MVNNGKIQIFSLIGVTICVGTTVALHPSIVSLIKNVIIF